MATSEDWEPLWNRRFAPPAIRPTKIVKVRTEEQVIEELKKAEASGMKVSVKSRGNNYEGYCLKDGGVVIDVSELGGPPTIDVEHGSISFGPGCTSQTLRDFCSAHNVMMTTAECPPISVTGMILGGGTGLLHRHLGLAGDNLLQVRVITPEHGVVDNDPDLLWACKGGGNGNFGVVTRMTVKVYPAVAGCNFRLQWKWHDVRSPFIIEEFQRWLVKTGTNLGSAVLTINDYQTLIPTEFTIVGLYLGSEEETRRILQPLLSLSPNEEEFCIEDEKQLGDACWGCSNSDPMKKFLREKEFSCAAGARWKSTGLISDCAVPADVVQKVVEQIKNLNVREICGFSIAWVGLGGRMHCLQEDSTPFPHRIANFNLRIVAHWNEEESDGYCLAQHFAIKRMLADSVTPKDEIPKHYFNYTDSDIAHYMTSYFKHNQSRLQMVKRKFDPTDMFNYAQGIPL